MTLLDFMNMFDMETLHYFENTPLHILNANLQNILEIISQPKNLWEHPLVNGAIAACAGALIGALISFTTQLYFTKCKEKQEKEAEEKRQYNVLKAAMAALEETRYSLLRFKSQFYKPYKEEQENIEKEVENKNETKIINVWQKNTPKASQTFPSIVLNGFGYGKELGFVSIKRAPYLVVFHKLTAELEAINYLIKQRNEFTEFYIKEIFSNKEETIPQIEIAYGLHSSAAEGLTNLSNSILALIILCKKYIEEYSKTFLPNYDIPNLTLETGEEELMPPPTYHEKLEAMIQEAIKMKKTRIEN